MSSLTKGNEFEWMEGSSVASKERRSYLLDDQPEYEEEIQFTRRRNKASGIEHSQLNYRSQDHPSSPLLNFKLLDLTSFDDELIEAGSSNTEGAMIDPEEVPIYSRHSGPFFRGQDTWERFQYEEQTTSNASHLDRRDIYHQAEDGREDPECEFFDLTALSSEDVPMSSSSASHPTQVTSNSRGTNISRFLSTTEELDAYGNHPSDHFDLTVLSEEEEEAFDKVFSAVSHVKHTSRPPPIDAEPTPMEQDIVDLTANSAPDAPIVDLTGLLCDSPDAEQFMENGSIILDLTHVDCEDDYRDDDWPDDSDMDYRDPFPSMPHAVMSYESCNSQYSIHSKSSNASTYHSGSFDWMTSQGVTKAGSHLSSNVSASRQRVRWLDQQMSAGLGIQQKTSSESKAESKQSSKARKDPEGVKDIVMHKGQSGDSEGSYDDGDNSISLEVDEDALHQVVSEDASDNVDGDNDDLAIPFTSTGSTDGNDDDENGNLSSKHVSRSVSASGSGSSRGSGREDRPKNVKGTASHKPTVTNTKGTVSHKPTATNTIKERENTTKKTVAASTHEATPLSPEVSASQPTSISVAASSFLSSLLWDTSVACQSQPPKPKATEPNEQPKEDEDKMEASKNETSSNGFSHSFAAQSKRENSGEDNPLVISPSYDDNLEGDASRNDDQDHDQDMVGMESSQTSLVKRDEAERLRHQRNSRQQLLSSYLESSGKRHNSTKAPTAPGEADAESGPSIEVSIVEKNKKSKKDKSKDKDKDKDKDKKKKDKKDKGSDKSKSKSKTKSSKNDTHETTASSIDNSMINAENTTSGKSEKTKPKESEKETKKKHRKDKSKAKKAKKKSKKDKKKGKSESSLTVTWKRIKTSLQPWKKRDVALFAPSSSEEDDTDRDSKAMREEVRRSIERAAAVAVGRISRPSSTKSEKGGSISWSSSRPDNLSIVRSSSTRSSKKAKKSLKIQRKPVQPESSALEQHAKVYDGDADTNSEHESRRERTRHHERITEIDNILTRTIKGGEREIAKMDEIDMEVQLQTAAAAQAAIAIAAASRVEQPTRKSFLEGDIPRPTSKVDFAEDFADEEVATQSEYATDEAGENNGNFYLRDKENKSMGSQVSQSQSNVTSYSTALEDSDNEGDLSNTSDAHDSYYSSNEDENQHEDNGNRSDYTPLPHSRHENRIVPLKPSIIIDPVSSKGNESPAIATQDFMWLYGKDVKLPLFLRACMHCPTAGGCCDVWQTSQPPVEVESSKQKVHKSSDSYTYTTDGSTLNSPLSCLSPGIDGVDDSLLQKNCKPLLWGDQPSPFCNVPESFYSDLSQQTSPNCSPQFISHNLSTQEVNPADTDNEGSTSNPSAITTTFNLIDHACGSVVHKASDGQSHASAKPHYFGDGGYTVKPNGSEEADNRKVIVIRDQCGAFNNGATESLFNQYNQFVNPSSRTTSSKKSKKTSETLPSTSKKTKGRRSRRRSKRPATDDADRNESFDFASKHLQNTDLPIIGSPHVDDEPTTADTFKGIALANDDAFALLSKQAPLHDTTHSALQTNDEYQKEARRLRNERPAREDGYYSTDEIPYASASQSSHIIHLEEVPVVLDEPHVTREEFQTVKKDSPSKRKTARNRRTASNAVDANAWSNQTDIATPKGSSVKSNCDSTHQENSEEDGSGEKSLAQSRASSVFTPEDQDSLDDISLGYSESFVDTWSIGGGLNEKSTSPAAQAKKKMDASKKLEVTAEKPEKAEAKEVKAVLPIKKSSQPISNFVMSIFGGPSRGKADEASVDEEGFPNLPNKLYPTLSEVMERPASLRSLTSYDSDAPGAVGSDVSMSSLSLSLNSPKNRKNGIPQPSSSLDRKRLELLVSDLMSHPNGYIFSKPVDAKEFPDYHVVVKHPMDLGTILKKLLSAGYPTLLDFHADVSLTFENAKMYNPEGTPVHEMAIELKEIFETNFLELLDQLEEELIEKEKEDEDARLAI